MSEKKLMLKIFVFVRVMLWQPYFVMWVYFLQVEMRIHLSLVIVDVKTGPLVICTQLDRENGVAVNNTLLKSMSKEVE